MCLENRMLVMCVSYHWLHLRNTKKRWRNALKNNWPVFLVRDFDHGISELLWTIKLLSFFPYLWMGVLILIVLFFFNHCRFFESGHTVFQCIYGSRVDDNWTCCSDYCWSLKDHRFVVWVLTLWNFRVNSSWKEENVFCLESKIESS